MRLTKRLRDQLQDIAKAPVVRAKASVAGAYKNQLQRRHERETLDRVIAALDEPNPFFDDAHTVSNMTFRGGQVRNNWVRASPAAARAWGAMLAQQMAQKSFFTKIAGVRAGPVIMDDYLSSAPIACEESVSWREPSTEVTPAPPKDETEAETLARVIKALERSDMTVREQTKKHLIEKHSDMLDAMIYGTLYGVRKPSFTATDAAFGTVSTHRTSACPPK